MSTGSNISTSPTCPACGSVNARYVAKKDKWSCQDPDCAELFSADSSAQLEQVGGFTKRKIFLSYAHKVVGVDDVTADLVDEIKDRLEQAGHEAWIDVQQLHPGNDWRLGITDGIITSNRILSFLSPRSVREPGVCLDEIGISMSHKFGAIATLLADSRVVKGIPASVSHVQYLDLSNWQVVKAQGEHAWTPWLSENVAKILDIIARNSGFAGEIEELASQLSPLPQTAKIGVLIEQGLIGREWVEDAINTWRLNKIDQRMFWLMAGPGMGKSAIAADLVHYSKLHVVAHHFCDYNVPESRSAPRFVQNLAFMLAARLPDYRRLLQTQLKMLTKPLAQYTADEMMLRLVVEPLRNKIDGDQTKDRLLVVIDALDEALPELPELLNRYLSSLPSWLGFVATSRPDVKEALAGFPAFELKIDDSQNINDLQAYLRDWQKSKPEVPLGPLAQKELIESSGGSILYLVMARQGYERGLFDLADLTQLPKGIAGIYRTWMQRQFGTQPQDNPSWARFCYPLLELLCATPTPVPQGIAAGLLGWKGQGRHQALSPLGSLVTLEAGALRLCHRSLGEWLTDDSTTNNPYWVNSKEAKLKLAQGLLKALPVALQAKEPGYLHLALPAVALELDAEQCRELFLPDWQAAVDQFKHLDNFLGNFHTRVVYEAVSSLRKWLVQQHQAHFGLEHPDTLSSMNNLASTLSEQGDWTGARALQEQVLTLQLKTLGQEHPNTLTIMNNLAATLSKQGDWAGARALEEQVLALRRKILGEEHPDTLTSMGNLAVTLSKQGDWAGARALLEQVLALQRKIFGEEHPDTLTSMNNLAATLSKQGDWAGARALEEQVLALRRKIFGEEHPDTLTGTSNLALTLLNQGDWAGARALQEQVLTLMRKIFGEEHPNTLTSMNNFALTLLNQGDWAGARALLEQVLALHRNALGEEHPDTLRSVNNLALTLSKQGDWAGARALEEQVLMLMCKIFGKEHPDTLTSMNNLASTLSNQGDWAGARALLEQVLALHRNALGEEHPDTLRSVNNLALTLLNQGDWAGARALQEQVLTLMRKILGEEHPNTLTSMNNLAVTLYSQGDLAGTSALLEQVLTLQRKILGEEHADTVTCMHNLASTLSKQGDLAGARALQEQALTLMRKILGEEHPNTLTSMNNLAVTLYSQGDLAGTRALLEQVLTLQRKILGEQHADTVTSMHNLASTLSDQGDWTGARALQEQVLTLRRKILGEEHPDTLTSMNNLAWVVKAQGDAAGARAL